MTLFAIVVSVTVVVLATLFMKRLNLKKRTSGKKTQGGGGGDIVKSDNIK